MLFGKKKYETSANLEGYKLEYKGSGTRKALVFDLYSAALYANEKFYSTQEAIESNTPKILVTTILTPLLNGNLLSQVFKDALKRTEFGQLPEIESDINDIVDLFRKGKIARFDKFEFLCTVETGFTAYQNGVKKYNCPNPLLSKAVLEVYIGKFHKDQDLPNSIVGI